MVNKTKRRGGEGKEYFNFIFNDFFGFFFIEMVPQDRPFVPSLLKQLRPDLQTKCLHQRMLY